MGSLLKCMMQEAEDGGVGVDIGTNIHICQTSQHGPDAFTLQCGLVNSEREGGGISSLQIS